MSKKDSNTPTIINVPSLNSLEELNDDDDYYAEKTCCNRGFFKTLFCPSHWFCFRT
jgi:hypothetical protein